MPPWNLLGSRPQTLAIVAVALFAACQVVLAADSYSAPENGTSAAVPTSTREQTDTIPQSDFWTTSFTDTIGIEKESTPCPCPDGKADCDCQKAAELKKAVASSHKPLFYDNKFDYVCDPCYEDWWPGDHFKRISVGDCLTIDAGGQYRLRLMNERNHRGLGINGRDDDFLLHRTRIFTNVEVGEVGRVYAEFLDAESNYEDFPPRGIEVNRADLLNLFADLRLYHGDEGTTWGRFGRQELLYGAQRLISPLDWANTRRTFEGGKVFWKGSDWSLDGFYTRPVFPNDHAFDSPDYDEEFMGFYATYKKSETQVFDAYYLVFNNGDLHFNYDTIGARLQGSRCDWLWEFEAAYQFGQNSDDTDHSAGFWVAGLGYKFPEVAWKPTLWAYYDWASGSDDRGQRHGFDHLFPLAHQYMGFMDIYARSNIETPNVQLTLQPTEKIKLLFWGYYFFLENRNDTPYNVTMTPYNPANAPASADLGYEFDSTLTYALNARTSILFGYSHFFAGDYYALTPGVAYRGDADFFYTQATFNF